MSRSRCRRTRTRTRTRAPCAVLATSALILSATLWGLPSSVRAQERDSIPSDVRVGIIYQPAFRPGVAVPTFEAPQDMWELADSARAIIRRDLNYSDRLETMSVGRDLPRGGPVNYGLWDEMGAVWLLIGAVEGSPDAPVLRLSLHDVVFRVLQEVRSFDLPPLGHPGFRMAVHGAADRVVRWATGTPGVAATRIAYVARGSGGSEIHVVDSDGFGIRSITSDGSIALSPAWAPDGSRLAYMSYRDGDPAIYELDLAEGRSSRVTDAPGLDMTPTYSPDGTQLAYASTVEGRTEIFTYDLAQRCCAKRITHVRYSNSLSPTYSPDGRRIAFNSDRLGQLHIFTMTLPDGSAELVTPYVYDRSVHNAGPDWSPQGDRVAFHGWVDGQPQIFTVAPGGSGVRQLTQQGRNEDPSWAPDGRHLVFASNRSGYAGLWILDVVSGRLRRLARGDAVRLPDWSGRLDSQTRLTDGTATGAAGQNP